MKISDFPRGVEVDETSLLTLFNGQMRDPIYGYVDYIKEIEGVVLDSWVMQRLKYIYQLQTAHFVYPGATHTRFSHAVGTMYSSFKYISFLLRSIATSNIPEDTGREIRENSREITLATRLLGLLHDIGHGPFSHAFDKQVYKTRDFLGYRIGNHEVMGYIIYRDYLRDLVEKTIRENKNTLDLNVEYLLDLLDSGLRPPSGMSGFTDLVDRGILDTSEFYDPGETRGFQSIVRMVVRDYVYTSDIMDYLKRDSYFTGVSIGDINDDWIIRNSFIIDGDRGLTIAVSSKALDEIARLFDARRIMYKYVYLHPVNVAFIETISSLISCIKSYVAGLIEDALSSLDKLVKYMLLNDHSLYSKLQELYFKQPSEYECEDKSFARQAAESIFYTRKPIWKLVKRFTYDMREAGVFFGEIGESVQRAMISKIKSEISSRFSSRGISENDVNVVIDKIEIYPSAAMEIVDRLEVVDVKDGRVVYTRPMSFEEFSVEYGLKSDVLISIYANRKKYKSLSQRDLEEIIGISEKTIESSIRGRKKEAPETS